MLGHLPNRDRHSTLDMFFDTKDRKKYRRAIDNVKKQYNIELPDFRERFVVVDGDVYTGVVFNCPDEYRHIFDNKTLLLMYS